MADCGFRQSVPQIGSAVRYSQLLLESPLGLRATAKMDVLPALFFAV